MAKAKSELPLHTLKIPCTLMRGGTSRGLVFKARDLPVDPELRDLIFLAGLGSPDIRQLDGVGAGDSHTSKIAIVDRSERDDADVDFTFGELSIDEPRVDYAGNSGNIIAAIGLFAVEESMVRPQTPETLVRIFNTNTGKHIEVVVPVQDGQAAEDGDFIIDGVPGFGPRIDMRLPNPGGAVTGKLLPDGSAVSTLHVDGLEPLEVSLVDAANPVVLIDARAMAVDPRASITELNADTDLRARLQKVRGAASVRMGLVQSVSQAWDFSSLIPFPVLLFEPSSYRSFADSKRLVEAVEMDLCARVLSLNLFHKSINVTVSTALTAAALIPGTLAYRFSAGAAESGKFRIGHPSGILETRCRASRLADGQIEVDWVALGRTARRILQGELLVQPYKLRWLAGLRR